VEAYSSVPGGSLMDAIEKTAEYREGGEPDEVEEARNEQSLAQLEMMMRGVK
jgi:hypothetical protein